MRRILLTVVAMLIPVMGVTLAVAGGTASAGTAKLTCTSLSGSASGTITVSGCTGGDTGGGSQPLSALALATGGNRLASGSSTTIGAPTLIMIAATKCPGYVKNAPTNPTAESFSANVTADSGDGMLLPATSVGEVCLGTDGSITALKSMTTEWTSSSLTCSTISGSASGDISVSGCTGGDTGGGSTALPALDLATGGIHHLAVRQQTTIGAPTLPSLGEGGPGNVKNAATNPTAETFTAVVTSDSGDGLKLPGSAKGAVCLGTDGSVRPSSHCRQNDPQHQRIGDWLIRWEERKEPRLESGGAPFACGR